MEDAHGKALKLCYKNRIDLPHAQPRRESFEIEESPRAPSPTTYTKDCAASSQNPTAEMSSDFTAFLFHQVSRFP